MSRATPSITAIYQDRPVRRGLGVTLEPDTLGEVAWVDVDHVGDDGTAEVWDVVTGDPAESFLAEGVVVHNCGNKAVRTELRAPTSTSSAASSC